MDSHASHPSDKKEGGHQAGASSGDTDYLDRGIENVEQRVGGSRYDADKMKGPNKKISQTIKDKFQGITGHKMPGTHE